MKTSRQQLINEAQKAKFHPEILEKVWWLLEILEEIDNHPFLKGKVALKGGTALNLFYFDVPRLSVDIDLNYIGSVDKAKMLLQRPLIEKSLEAIFSKIGLSIHRIPYKHAGGKWQLKYDSHLTGRGNLDVDLNFMFRLPIYDMSYRDSRIVGNQQAKHVLLVNYHEIAAGKLTALFARHASRDLFDTYHLLNDESLDKSRLRLLFCVFGAMSSIDWRTISLDKVNFEAQELSQQLVPVLGIGRHKEWVKNVSAIVEKCREKLNVFLPFTKNERLFFDLLYDEGKVDASLLTDQLDLIEKIQGQPLIKWKSELVLQNQ
ncbi:MAG: nucleotidyl transferase AbiEii/AbiGii toxin family protein [Rhabdochlamydiaceae bacterium]|jgi:predicted nucleotidyltransferase component of viral defense system